MNATDLIQSAFANSIDPDEFLQHVWALSNGAMRTAKNFLGTEIEPIRLYRARRFECDSKLPVKTCELSYPPFSQQIGRVGAANTSILFASAGIETTFPESRCKDGDIVVVAEYRCYGPMMLHLLVNQEQRTSHREYETLLHTVFTHPGNELYKYSSKISEHLIKADFIHGLLYPSIITGSDSDNIALKANFCDQSLSLAHATAYRVKGVGPTFKYEVEQFDFAKPRSGALEWKGRKKKWELRGPVEEYKIVQKGAAYDVFDKTGRLIDPD